MHSPLRREAAPWCARAPPGRLAGTSDLSKADETNSNGRSMDGPPPAAAVQTTARASRSAPPAAVLDCPPR